MGGEKSLLRSLTLAQANKKAPVVVRGQPSSKLATLLARVVYHRSQEHRVGEWRKIPISLKTPPRAREPLFQFIDSSAIPSTINLERPQKSPGALAIQGLEVVVALIIRLHHEQRPLTLLSRKQGLSKTLLMENDSRPLNRRALLGP